MSSRTVNRTILRWVINYKQLQLHHGELLLSKGTKMEIHAADNLRKSQIQCYDDGHSYSRYVWTKQQSMLVDEIGWNNWTRRYKEDEHYPLNQVYSTSDNLKTKH